MTESEAGIGDGGIVDNRHEARRVRHQRFVEQRLVTVAKAHQVDITFKVTGFLFQMPHDPLHLPFDGLDGRGQQAFQAVLLALGGGERGALV